MQKIINKSEILINNSLQKSLINESNIDADFYPVIISDILRDKMRTFLGYHICDVQILKQPAGILFARKKTLTDFKIISKNVDVQTTEQLVNISQEAWEDLVNLTKHSLQNEKDENEKPEPTVFTNWIKSCLAFKESQKLLKLIKDNAIQDTTLILSNDNDSLENAETSLFHILKKVNDCVIKMNSNNFRTFDAFCILPQNNIGGVLSLSFAYSRIDDSSDENRASDYFLGKVNNTRFYINPDQNETNVLVGLNSKIDKGANSVIYSPYNMNITKVVNYDNGELLIRMYARSGFSVNPMHSEAEPMLMKFEINSK